LRLVYRKFLLYSLKCYNGWLRRPGCPNLPRKTFLNRINACSSTHLLGDDWNNHITMWRK